MQESIAEIFTSIPLFTDVEPDNIMLLPGGMTNRNYRIENGDNAYVLRIGGASTQALGIRRDVEYLAHSAASALGIAPETVYVDETRGVLVTRFVAGERIVPEDMRSPENLHQVAQKLRRFHHEAPSLPVEADIFQKIERLHQEIHSQHGILPRDYSALLERVRLVRHLLSRCASEFKPCHNDLVNLNFLKAHDDVYILDWETAGMGDIFSDLADFAQHHQLTDEQTRFFLTSYFGTISTVLFARLKLLWLVAEVQEALWGTLQARISSLEQNFQAYADYWFERAFRTSRDPHWQEWLDNIVYSRENMPT